IIGIQYGAQANNPQGGVRAQQCRVPMDRPRQQSVRYHQVSHGAPWRLRSNAGTGGQGRHCDIHGCRPFDGRQNDEGRVSHWRNCRGGAQGLFNRPKEKGEYGQMQRRQSSETEFHRVFRYHRHVSNHCCITRPHLLSISRLIVSRLCSTELPIFCDKSTSPK
ncbi:hypothetical protein PRIPAC_87359, partial [Pristionchus pacificus]